MPIQLRRRGESEPLPTTQNVLSEPQEVSSQEVSDGGEPLPPVVPFRGGWVYADDPEYLASLVADDPVGENSNAALTNGEAMGVDETVYVSPPLVQQENPVENEALVLQKKVEFLRTCTPGVLAEVYVQERDKRREADALAKKRQANMDIVASVIFEKMDELKLDSFRPDSDKRIAVTDSEIRSATVFDREAFIEFVRNQLITGTDPDALDYLENRASITTADEFADSNNGELPPGVKINRIRRLKVSVTQSKNGKKK